MESVHRAETMRVGMREPEEDDFSDLFSDSRDEGASAQEQEAFDLDEVLYPKDLPDLESLCEELGLNKE